MQRTGVPLFNDRLLNQHPIPALLPEQLQRFTDQTLQTKPVRDFDPRVALAALRAANDKAVIAVDIGGDKLTASLFTVTDGAIRRDREVLNYHSYDGAGYLSALLKVRETALREMVPVGISFAGPTDDARLIAGPNLPIFSQELREACNSDFANLFPQVEVANDAEAGMLAGDWKPRGATRMPATSSTSSTAAGSAVRYSPGGPSTPPSRGISRWLVS